MGVFCLMLAISTKHESILNASSVCTPVFTLSNSHLIFIFVINGKIHFDFSCCKNVSLVTQFLSEMNAWPRPIGNSYILLDTFGAAVGILCRKNVIHWVM